MSEHSTLLSPISIVAVLMCATHSSVMAQSSGAKVIRTESVVSSGVISQVLITTTVKAQSQTISFNTANRLQSSIQQTEQITIQVPDMVRNTTLHFDRVRLNGQLIPLASKKEDSPRIGPKYVHLFFDRVRVADILGPQVGNRVLTVEITFGGGHLLLGSDVIKLLKVK